MGRVARAEDDAEAQGGEGVTRGDLAGGKDDRKWQTCKVQRKCGSAC